MRILGFSLLWSLPLAWMAYAGADETLNLQARIDQAQPESVITVPKGTWKERLVIKKPLTLKGESREACVLEMDSDQPLIWLQTAKPVRIEGLTLRWQRATSGRPETMPCAVLLQDSTAVISDCRIIAPGSNARCPAGVAAQGFSDLTVERCHFEGFEFTIQYWGGAQGKVTDCLLLKPGHCGE